MSFKRILIAIFISFFTLNLSAQIESKGIPYIKNYSRTDYDGNFTTFSIVQDDRGVLYFANQTYILEFDGKTWKKIFLPGDPTIYSLEKDKNGRIYVGARGEFGYLEATPEGNLKYKSLKEKIPNDKKDFTVVNYVINGNNDDVIFVSPLTIYIFENDTVKTLDVSKPENVFVRPFNVNGRILIQEKNKGVFEYKNDKLEFLKGTEKFAYKFLVGMFPKKNGEIIFNVFGDSLYYFKNNKIKAIQNDEILKKWYSSYKYNDKYNLGGLYGQGLVITDDKFNVIKHLSTKNGLQNNSVYSVFADKDKNIWLGLNDGISVIFPNLPYSVFSENSNLTGAIYTSKFFNNKLYIGGPTEIMFKDFLKKNSKEGERFKLVKKSGSAQNWKIDDVNGKLLCATSIGLYEINDSTATLIGPKTSIKNFIQLKSNPKLMLTIGGHGLKLFEFKKDNLGLKNSIKNFKGDYKHIVEDDNGSFWISDQTKGIILIKVNEKMDSVIEQTLYTEKDGLPSAYNNYVYNINGKIVFTTEKGIYDFAKQTHKFIKDKEFDKIFGRDISITNLYQATNGNIWFKEELNDPKIKNKKHWELGLIKKIGGEYKVIKTPFYKVRNRINSINQISDNELVVGTEKGFVLYDLNTKKQFEEPFKALIRKVEFIKNDSILFGGAFVNDSGKISLLQNSSRIPKIPYEFNDLRFFFASVFYEEPEKTQYKFILQGNDTEWSDWKFKTDKEYSNLAPGTYTMTVKAKNLYDVESTVAEYTFEILPPWYRTFGAFFGYFILIILFIYGIIQLSVARLKRQRENLKRIVEERTKEIQIQKEEIEAKNDTLSMQNEEIIQKNESITSSINYAKRIQEAMLPVRENISTHLTENFLLFKPRDIVSGDFYWYSEKNDKIIYTAVDCTGHGVPGALMSMIGSEILGSIVNADGITKADVILEKMNDAVVKVLKQDKEGFSQDGMDMALCVIDKKNKTVEYAGAKNPLVYITNGELTQIKASRFGIGGYQEAKKDFESHLIKYESPTWFYMFSDGYPDQFGGPNNRKFMIKRLKNLLMDIHYKPMQEQHDILDKTIEEWMENTNQTDDIIVTGFKL